MTLAAPGFDVPRFRDWLSEVTGEPAEVSVSSIRGGGSCEMFRVDRLGQSWVVRRAPLAAVSDTAHQVIREAQNHAIAGGHRRSPCRQSWPLAKIRASSVPRSSS